MEADVSIDAGYDSLRKDIGSGFCPFVDKRRQKQFSLDINKITVLFYQNMIKEWMGSDDILIMIIVKMS